MPIDNDNLRTWLEGRLDRQDALVQQRFSDLTKNVDQLRKDMDDGYQRKDVATEVHKNVNDRLDKLEAKTPFRITVLAITLSGISTLIVVLSYLHIIPH